jgi:hypothetical protein
MSDEPSTRSPEAVRWERAPAGSFRDPITVEVPYLELTLEHPGLEPTELGESFFPDAIPYILDGEQRVFYWRNALTPIDSSPPDWRGVCATTHQLAAIPQRKAHSPTLYGRDGNQFDVVVDGTVAGDSTSTRVRCYEPPAVTVADITAEAVTVETAVGSYGIPVGDRASISLPERQVTLEADESKTTISPRLSVRYPGQQTVYHPDPTSEYRLFPSFDLDLDALANPVTIPTSHDELEPIALADTLDVDLVSRPYPERVLWQAFAFEVFDPHRDGCPRLAQYPSGLLAVDR